MTEAGERGSAKYERREAVEAISLFIAGVITALGNSLAGVAAGFLVSARTGSASLTALTLAAAYLPGLAGGLGLGGLADRFPRREVCIVCELLSVPVTLCIVIPGMPVPAIIALIAAIELIGQPVAAARTALVTQVLSEHRLARFIGLDRTANALCLFLGVVVGAATVGLFGAPTALVLDAGTFGLSALILTFGVRARSKPHHERHVRLVGGARDGWRTIRASPLAFRAVLVTWCAVAASIVLEGLAIPLARVYSGEGAESGATTSLVALLLGSMTGVAVIGSFIGSWLRVHRQRILMVPLAFASILPPLALMWRPNQAIAIVIYALSGLSVVASVFGQIQFSTNVPDASFGRAMGVAAGGVSFVQGVALIFAAGLAEVIDVQDVVATSAASISVLLILSAILTRIPDGRHSTPITEPQGAPDPALAASGD